jgi:hypothetical protein
MTTRRLYLLGIGTFLLLLTGAVARVWLQPWAEPLEVAARSIRPGMSVEEVKAIVGRESDLSFTPAINGWYSGQPDQSFWFGKSGYLRVRWVMQNDAGMVESAEWFLPDELQACWYRLLHPAQEADAESQ